VFHSFANGFYLYYYLSFSIFFVMSHTASVSLQQRFTALDIFRGMTVCFMIIVNTPGNGATTYWPLLHADWHGFTPTDLVFPSFLFAVGNALSFAMKKWGNMSQGQVVYSILKRTLLIFLVGYLMYWFPFFTFDDQSHLMLSPIAHTRIMGVLQRIALCYGIVALLVYFFDKKITIRIGVALLFVYWALLYFFGVQGAEYTKAGNAVLRLDSVLLGTNHLYTGEGLPFDPEGLLSTLSSIFNVVAGLAVGSFLQKKGMSFEAIAKILLAACGLLFLAYCWNDFLPVNKKLWTSSYALLTVGLDCVLLSFVIFIVDFVKFTRGSYFFQVFGRNPLFIYLLAELGVTVMFLIPVGGDSLYGWLYNHVFSLAGAYLGSFLFALWWMLACWLVGLLLDKKKVYIKL
jgi:predicted acyltransferase